MSQFRSYAFLILLFSLLTACQQPGVVPAGRAPMATLSNPACPNLTGTYEMFGDPLPGMPPYFHKATAKVTLDRLLGLNWPAEDINKPKEVQLVQEETIELASLLYERGAEGRMPLLPGDSVVCSRGEVTIRQARESRGSSFEQLWRITRTVRNLKIEQDGTLVVQTNIRAAHKSSLLAEEVSVETYGAKFRRLN
jgi:hypothetical protein